MGKFFKTISSGIKVSAKKFLEGQRKIAEERKKTIAKIQRENKAAKQILARNVRQARRQAIQKETIKQVKAAATEEIKVKFKAKKTARPYPDVVYKY